MNIPFYWILTVQMNRIKVLIVLNYLIDYVNLILYHLKMEMKMIISGPGQSFPEALFVQKLNKSMQQSSK